MEAIPIRGKSNGTNSLLYVRLSNRLHTHQRLSSPTVTSTAFSSIVTFDQDSGHFRDLLIQMALSDGTLGSQAVLFALLAFSSQSRDGLQSRAVEFRTSAIRALAKSAETGALSTHEAAQHVAAGMLLCSFEVS